MKIPSSSAFSTLVEMLRSQAAHSNQPRITFLHESEGLPLRLTLVELDRQARAIAALLQERQAPLERTLLLYPPGLDFLSAFFGCLYAGVIAVPAYPPRANRPLPRLQALVEDAGATVALTTTSVLANLESRLPQAPYLRGLHFLATDAVPAGAEQGWKEPANRPEAPALLQYTSGSTTTPRGVMVSHANLLANMSVIQRSMEMKPTSHMVSWLPPYHDMGLLSILVSLFVGFPLTLLSPPAFLKRPLRWLQAISEVRATISGAPNFAFDLCCRKIPPEQRTGLDLSSWDLAFVGAEPVRAGTMERFAASFAPWGFRPEFLYPCYGLAEATLFVTGGGKSEHWVAQPVRREALEKMEVVPTSGTGEGVRTLVGCGQVPPEHDVRIVDPQTRIQCSPSRVGEVWVKSPGVSRGYWGRPEETRQVLQASLADTGEEPFLRSGDLGFLQGGQLFITGRLKEVVIVRGRLHYASDIEATVEQSHPALQPGGSAAFSLDKGDEEQLIIVAETERSSPANLDEVIGALRQAVLEHHEVEVSAVRLIRIGTIPKTSSGKIQRHTCRDDYVRESLTVVKDWTAPSRIQAEPLAASPPQAATREAIQEWLTGRIARRLGVPAGEIDVRKPFAHWGLDSAAVVSMAGELESWLGRSLSPILLYDYPSIELLASHLIQTTTGPCSPLPDSGGLPLPRSPGTAAQPEPVAVIGMSCRFPGAGDVAAFWQLLRDGVDAILEAPQGRGELTVPSEAGPTSPGKLKSRHGGFLEKVDEFDPLFFGISAREAVRMDPQQRFLLEVAWEALEDAGQVVDRLAGSRTGVFVGICNNEYSDIQGRDPNLIDGYWSTGNAFSIAANRLSYLFDFRGPSLAIDTACSASLVAIHLACRSLAAGESTLALAGGVNLILSPATTISFAKGGALAADGRCKPFDARADGIVRGEGAGILVLKPLSRAQSDGDPIWAVIRSSAVNQDGRSNGLTAPNGLAQEAVLREAYRSAGISPGQVQYIEAHGTGTLLGDPIEAKALGNVLAEGRGPDRPCALGSVKSNIGHLEAAAGVASAIKAILALHHRVIPPSLHFNNPNPHIPFQELNLYVPRTAISWPKGDHHALAGVSAFGFGGTNAHLVLEEAPQCSHHAERDDYTCHLLPFSARSPEALTALAQNYHDLLTRCGPEALGSLADLAYTAGLRRTHHPHKLNIVARTGVELAERLSAFLEGKTLPGMSPCHLVTLSPCHLPKGVVFVFSGQGSQWRGMGRELLEEEPVFRATLEQCDALVRRLAGWSVLEELTADESHWRLGDKDVAYTQPVLFAFQAGLAALWASWGIRPAAVVGHSLGEVTAAYVAGALSLEDAVGLSYHRGRLMHLAATLVSDPGAMAAARLSLEAAREALAEYQGRLSVAAHNSPESVVLSGESAALKEVVAQLKEKGVACRLLPVPGAGHSPVMDLVKADLVQALGGLAPRQASIPFYSTVTGRACAGTELGAAHWGDNIRQPVLFAKAIAALAAEGHVVFLEISPHSILSSPLSQCLAGAGREATVLPSLRRQEPERAALLGSLGQLNSLGCAVAWEQLDRGQGHCVRLPAYPWQRKRYWFEAGVPTNGQLHAQSPCHLVTLSPCHPLLGRHLKSALHPNTHFWEGRLDPETLSSTGGHWVQGKLVLSVSASLEMALAAGARVFGSGPRALENVTFSRPLFLGEKETRAVQLVASGTTADEAQFHLFSLPEGPGSQSGEPVAHVTGAIRLLQGELERSESPAAIQARCPDLLSSEEHYRLLEEAGAQYEPGQRGLSQLWRGNKEALGQLCLPEAVAEHLGAYQVHPALLDSCFQVLAAAVPPQDRLAGGAYLPIGLRSLRCHALPRVGKELWSHARLRSEDAALADELEGDVSLFDSEGRLLLEATGLHFRTLDALTPPNPDEWLYEIAWEPKQRASAPGERNAVSVPAPPLGPRGSWLVFTDSTGTAAMLTPFLEGRGDRVVQVSPGDSYQQLGPEQFRINPGSREDFRRLLQEVSRPDRPPCRGVVHLWSLDAPTPAQTNPQALNEAQLLGCGSVLHLVQTLAQRSWPVSFRLWLVTLGAQTVGTPEPQAVAFAQAPLWGLGRVLPQEHPELHSRLLDLDHYGAENGGALYQELFAEDGEDQIVLRGAERLVARLVRMVPADRKDKETRRQGDKETEVSTLSLSPCLLVSLSPCLFPPDGTYLITGGTGGIGLALARWLIKHGARHLVLVARRDPSDTAGKAIEALRQSGAEVLVARADVARDREVADLLATLDSSLPPLRGLFHAAGILEDGLLVGMDNERFQAVLAPKVAGAWNLHAQTLGRPLDHFVLFSSAAALLGPPGMAGYPAANCFLDALAQHRHAAGLPALSVNWAAWAGLGMAASEQRQRRSELHGLGTIPPELALTLLGRLLRCDRPQVGVLPLHVKRLRRAHPVWSSSPLLARLFTEAAGPQPSANHAPTGGEDLARLIRQTTDPKERPRLLEACLRAQVAGVLGIAPRQLDVHQPLNNLGVDSLIAIELKHRVEAELEVVIPVVKFLQGPSVSQLTAVLLEQIELPEAAPLVGRANILVQPAGADNPEQLLKKLPDLSNEEVSVMLRSLLTEEETAS
jgi:acyl transferase domain-containing protein/acyl-CoA synthetase (AMP-forming)/AMP-acid ligase II/acyl carrier protein